MKPTEEDHLPPYRVRPRFQIETKYSVEELVGMIKAAVAAEPGIDARILDGYATLFIPKEEQHYWSPQLTLSVEGIENGSLLRGIYGPRPAVWTMFVFFYTLIGFAILVLALFGFTNYSLGNPAKILWFVPLLSLVFLTLYFISYFGQKLGHDQMIQLHSFVEESIGVRIDSRKE